MRSEVNKLLCIEFRKSQNIRNIVTVFEDKQTFTKQINLAGNVLIGNWTQNQRYFRYNEMAW